jgi:DNA-binding NarL/FixJ family response regulator
VDFCEPRTSLNSPVQKPARIREIRILVADDRSLTLFGIRAVLEQDYGNIATVTNGRQLVEHALELRPDLIILDITMPMLNGIDAAIQIRNNLPSTKLLFVSMRDEPVYLEAARNAGAAGYLLRSATAEEFIEAVDKVLEGGIYVTPGRSDKRLKTYHESTPSAAFLPLTSRERETLQLISEGKAAKQIAFNLRISVSTVSFHRANVCRKLGLRTTAQLTRYFIESQLV